VLRHRVGSSFLVGGVRGGHFLRGGFATVEATSSVTGKVLLGDCWWNWGSTGGTGKEVGVGPAGTSGGGGLEAGAAGANCGVAGARTMLGSGVKPARATARSSLGKVRWKGRCYGRVIWSRQYIGVTVVKMLVSCWSAATWLSFAGECGVGLLL
jgi:hypothetical protein